jgi:F-box domain
LGLVKALFEERAAEQAMALPNEVVELIVVLGGAALAARQVCRRWRTLVDEARLHPGWRLLRPSWCRGGETRAGRFFYEHCQRGNLPAARWTTEYFNLDLSGLPPPVASAIMAAACQSGGQELVRWLAVHFNLAEDGALLIGALADACEGGQLEIARWIAAEFSLAGDAVRAQNGWVLRKACAGGDLPTLSWLVDHFDLTRADMLPHGLRAAHALYPSPLCAAANDNSLLCWMMERFGFSASEARAAQQEDRQQNMRIGGTEMWVRNL